MYKFLTVADFTQQRRAIPTLFLILFTRPMLHPAESGMHWALNALVKFQVAETFGHIQINPLTPSYMDVI